MFKSKTWRYLEVSLHTILWLLYLFIMEFGLGTYWDKYGMHYIRTFSVTLPIVFYINSLWLIPTYLRKKRWINYTWRTVVLVIVVEVARSIVIGIFEFDQFTQGFVQTFSLSPFAERSLISYTSLGLILSFGYKFTKDWILNIGEIDKLKADKLEMELSFLKSQIDPHFLFNSLNSMYGLALEENGHKTADAIIKLSTLMRYNLHDSQAKYIPLSKEVDYIAKYIALQQLRATPQTTVNFNANISESHLSDQLIAPMLFIAFVENAFKFSAHPSAPVSINIYMEMKDEQIVFKVDNSISPIKPNSDSSGVGLENAKSRLKLIYPDRHSLIIKSHENTFQVELTINLAND